MKFPSDMSIQQIAEQIEISLAEEFDTQLALRIELTERKEECYKRYRAAAEMGDRRENAPLEEAQNAIKEVNIAIRECEGLISQLSAISDKSFRERLKSDTSDISHLRRYNPCPVVNMYTTVRLWKTGLEPDEEFVFRIYPKGISRPKLGVIAEDTPLATALFGKGVGEEALIPWGHNMIKYTIKEIY